MNEFIYLLFVSIFQLFLIVDPVALMPLFLSITKSNTHEERMKIARTSSLVAVIILLTFALVGGFILSYFKISIDAIKIGGGMLLFSIAFEMIYGKLPGTKITDKEHNIAEQLEDISITPLAIPLLAGPGAITTVLLVAGNMQTGYHTAILSLAILITGLISYKFLTMSDRITNLLGVLGTKVLVRIMGLILLFIAIQYVIDGVKSVLSGGIL